MVAELNDRTLIGAVAAGDPDALGALYDRHAARMLGVAHGVLGNRRDAEDLLHDVMLEVWRKAASYDAKRGSLQTWLSVKTRSRAIDRLRSLAVAQRHGMVPASDEYEAVDADADAELLRQAEGPQVKKAMELLSDAQRTVVEMSHVEGYSSTEIAERCGLAVGTVKSRLARAMTALRAELIDPEEST